MHVFRIFVENFIAFASEVAVIRENMADCEGTSSRLQTSSSNALLSGFCWQSRLSQSIGNWCQTEDSLYTVMITGVGRKLGTVRLSKRVAQSIVDQLVVDGNDFGVP